jgi:lipoate-protein ligase A
MKYIDLTLPTPAENLALDELLLDWCDDGLSDELLRIYEARSRFVVLGYANKAAEEVNLEACRADGIPIFRRSSGGGTVLQGPGCLSYTLILKIMESGPFQSISGTNAYILQRHQTALAAALKTSLRIQGHSDLVLGNLKFSGNAQRRKKNFLMFHGTFLLNFDISQVETYLRMPSKQPDYRADRPHAQFLTNIPLSPAETKIALRQAWKANEIDVHLPLAKLPDLVQKYASDAWNLKF